MQVYSVHINWETMESMEKLYLEKEIATLINLTLYLIKYRYNYQNATIIV